MKNPIILKILSCLVNLLSGLFAAILILYFQDWFGSGSGSMGGVMPDGGFSSESPLAIHYTDFQVYPDTIDRYNFKEERKLDSLTTTLVEECRKLKK